jgi:hypothetical protein
MKFAAWVMCWPLLGAMWLAATVGDAAGDVVYYLDDLTDRLLEYSEGE